MRNDNDDDLDLVSGLRASTDDEHFDQPLAAETKASAAAQAAPVFHSNSAHAAPPAAGVQVVKSTAGSGLLWAALILLLLALVALLWWGREQLAQINAQLIATQDSFAQTSEAAAGQLQDISGKVVAAESSIISERESMKLRIKQLETQQAESQRQVQALQTSSNALKDLQAKLESDLKAQKTALSAAEAALKKSEQAQATLQSSVQTELAALKRAQPQLEPLNAELTVQKTELAAVKGELASLKKADTAPEIRRLEQDLLILRSELETRASGQNTAEFDAFRGQMTRHINTLQGQVQNLQQQLDGLR